MQNTINEPIDRHLEVLPALKQAYEALSSLSKKKIRCLAYALLTEETGQVLRVSLITRNGTELSNAFVYNPKDGEEQGMSLQEYHVSMVNSIMAAIVNKYAELEGYLFLEGEPTPVVEDLHLPPLAILPQYNILLGVNVSKAE